MQIPCTNEINSTVEYKKIEEESFKIGQKGQLQLFLLNKVSSRTDNDDDDRDNDADYENSYEGYVDEDNGKVGID